MELTEEKIRDFFPSDNRFIHFCAKRYGYRFFNDDVVASAHYYSALNIVRMIKKKGRVFESEKDLYIHVMGCFRFGIMSAVSDRAKGRSVDSIPEADLIHTDDGYSTRYEKAIESNDVEFGGLELLIPDLRSQLSDVELIVLDEYMIKERTAKKVAIEHGIREKDVTNAKNRIRTKFKKLIKKEKENADKCNHEAEVQSVTRDVPKTNRPGYIHEREAKKYSYLKAMSFLHTEEEVQDEVCNNWLDGK